MARTKQLNITAIVKAYEAEAKRAERNAKAYRGESVRGLPIGVRLQSSTT
jgi:hypothetical protein